MKFKSILLLIVALSLLLCACNDTTITTEPEIAFSPSTSESETLSYVAGLDPLPDAYRIKGGKLKLYVGGDREDGYYNRPDGIMFKGLTAEQVKEKFLKVDFTSEEIEYMQKEMADDGYILVADPRLVTPLKLPEGCTQMGLSLSARIGKYRYGGVFGTGANVPENCEWGSQFYAEWFYAAGATGGVAMEEYDDYISLEELENPTNGFKCYTEKDGRIYYIEYHVQEEGRGYAYHTSIQVDTFNCNHRYRYSIHYPSEECVENILDYDPFTYLQVEY